MDYMNLPINKQEQYKKIIEDTEEIIQNFKEISEIMVSRLEKKNDTMYKLGKILVNQYPEVEEEAQGLGANQIKFIL